jgi:hypothetical protein
VHELKRHVRFTREQLNLVLPTGEILRVHRLFAHYGGSASPEAQMYRNSKANAAAC